MRALAAASFIAAGAVKLVGLPLLIWPLRSEAACLAAEPPAAALSPLWLARSAGFVVGQLHLFLTFWMLLGLFMIVAGAGLPRERGWARAGLGLVCWFGMFEAVSVAAFIEAVRRMLLRSDVAGSGPLAAALPPRFWIALAWLGVYVILLILLKRSGQGERADGQAAGQSQGARG
jgi:hypothetical protein